MNVEPWMKIYPSVADVQLASLGTLNSWDDHLPMPQTDVEYTVRRRIKGRQWELAKASVKGTKDEELLNRVEDTIERAEKLMGLKPGTFTGGFK